MANNDIVWDDDITWDDAPTKNVGEIRAFKPTIANNIQNALIGGSFGHLFLRNQPDIENEKRRQLLASFINTATFGTPQMVARGLGGQLAPVKAPVQAAIGGGLGLVSPITMGNQAARLVRGVSPLAQVARGTIQGGVSGALLPQDTLKQRVVAGGVGAGLGGGISLISSIAPKLINFGGRKAAQKIAEKADRGFDSLSKSLSDKYDDVLSKISGKVKSSDIIKDIQDTIDEFPEGANMGKLKTILGRLKDAKEGEISAKELFNIKKEISKTIPRSVWSGVSPSDAITNSKENLYWKLSEKLEGVGGEKLKGLTQEYKEFKQAERLARKMFYRGGVASNVPLSGTLDIPTQKAIGSLNVRLPPEKQFAQAFEAWRRGQAIKKMANYAIGGGAGLYILHRMLSAKAQKALGE